MALSIPTGRDRLSERLALNSVREGTHTTKVESYSDQYSFLNCPFLVSLLESWWGGISIHCWSHPFEIELTKSWLKRFSNILYKYNV